MYEAAIAAQRPTVFAKLFYRRLVFVRTRYYRRLVFVRIRKQQKMYPNTHGERIACFLDAIQANAFDRHVVARMIESLSQNVDFRQFDTEFYALDSSPTLRLDDLTRPTRALVRSLISQALERVWIVSQQEVRGHRVSCVEDDDGIESDEEEEELEIRLPEHIQRLLFLAPGCA